jgi:DNA-binding GntR family transcriptional regulator
MELSSVKTNLKEKAYRAIRENIISCAWLPGSLLNEKELAEILSVSRTPIREALNRLEQENLVKIVPQRGVFVSEITVKTISDVYQVREILEPFVVQLVTPKADPTALLRFHQLFNSCSVGEDEVLPRLDDEFHHFLIAVCDNDYLVQMMQNIYAQNERIRVLSTRLPRRLEETVSEHCEIIDAMLVRDADKAAHAMRVHIANSRYAAFRLNTSD